MGTKKQWNHHNPGENGTFVKIIAKFKKTIVVYYPR